MTVLGAGHRVVLAALAEGAPVPSDPWSAAVTLDPSVLVWLVVLVAAGVRLWRRRRGTATPLSAPRVVAFAAGLTALAAALVFPLDALGTALFSAHMGQHLLLTVVAPPLLLVGRAHVAVADLVPLATRRRLARRMVGPLRRRGPAGMLLAVPLHVVTVLAWHVPALYDLAVTDPVVHALEHATLVATALLSWAVLGLGRARPVPGAPLAAFVTTLAFGALAALLSFAPRPWYAAHLLTTQAWGFTPLEDQQLAGALMWIPGGFVYLGVAAASVVRWIRADEARNRRDAERKDGDDARLRAASRP